MDHDLAAAERAVGQKIANEVSALVCPIGKKGE
jgi:hypothetical protein